MRHYLKNFLVFIFTISMVGAFGQEYDDLYFTKEDRVKEKKKLKNRASQITGEQSPSNDEAMSFLGRQYQENNQVLEEEDLSPQDYYKPEKTQEDYINGDYAYSGQIQNPNYSDPQTTYNNGDIPQQVIVNNYYNDNWNSWNNWNRPRWRFGMGWNSWGGNFWSVSYGNAWNPWYDPFYDPFWDPWYFNAWGGPYWGWNSWAFNSWGWRSGWYSPYYGGYYNRPVYVVSNERRGRDVVRGARPSRGSVSSRESRSSSGRGAVVTSDVNSRSYSRQQADYLNRSRSSRYNPGTPSSRGSAAVGTTSRSDNSSYGNSGRSGSNNNYSRPSSSSSRSGSYSPPSSSGRNSSVGSSRSSRSSGGSVGRSGGSSSGRSSGGSRSSSGRSSSGRGGN
ncbi:MAG: hypothetical protein RLN88_14740 [Ekhidna sp.]|uniref:hypothetical protein n=1 Tax=Ekhidna sp. TaxID=2608089 RepID=UPI0032EFEDD3